MAKQYVLICCSVSDAFADSLGRTMKCAQEARKKGQVPIARCMDKDFNVRDPASVEEMREFEIDMMRRKFVDSVVFIDPQKADMVPVVDAARQWHLPIQHAA